MSHSPIVRKPGEGHTIALVGDLYRFLATGDETDGKYATMETVVPPGGGPPPHTHSREVESFYVLEGEVTFQVEEERFVARAGTFAHMPIGSLHAFKNESNAPARMLVSVAPAGFEKMFLEVGQSIAHDAKIIPPPTEAEVEKLIATAQRYGVEIKIPKQ
jgi:quercetin dioxygenase-like cupin family protein